MACNVRFLLCGLIFIAANFYILMSSKAIEKYRLSDGKLYSIYTEGCKIEYLHPYSPVAVQFIKNLSKFQCTPLVPLISSNHTSIWINRKSVQQRKLKRFTCCYRVVYGGSENLTTKMYKDENNLFGAECVNFRDAANIDHEFIEVTCTDLERNRSIYKDYHAFVPPMLVRSFINKIPPMKRKVTLSVLIIGLQSMSRAHFYRFMPKTAKILKQLNAYELYGMNSINQRNFANVMGMLTGENYKGFKKCSRTGKGFFDRCNFMWKEFQDLGYLTAFGESNSMKGLFHGGKMHGFRRKPTDIYLHPFMYINEKVIGELRGSKKVCTGDRSSLKVLFDYTRRFIRRMSISKTRYWAFFWGRNLFHDWFNIESNVDDIYHSVFKTLKEVGFDQTMVVFMSNQGRKGRYQKTAQGYFENRQPFAFILLSRKTRVKYGPIHKTLLNNQYRLVTPYDIGATVRHTMGVTFNNPVYRRGISLFEEIPENRTCRQALIPMRVCSCLTEYDPNPDNVRVHLTLIELRRHVNRLLTGKFNICYPLRISTILKIRLLNNRTTAFNIRRFFFRLRLIPGNGIFEATTIYNTITHEAKVEGEVVRLSSHDHKLKTYCLKDKFLYQYCTCIRFQIPKHIFEDNEGLNITRR